MIAQCWLHIGTEKTGSTSIQTFLARNRAGLVARGWFYPESAGSRTHYSLLAYSLDDERHDGTRRMFGIDDAPGLEHFRRRLIDSLRTELAASDAANLLLSNELLSTRLRRPNEILRLKNLCDSLASRTKVIVYIRNQADFLVSRYTNVVWEGGAAELNFRARTAIADYALLLGRWSQVFGKENIVVRRFDPSEFPRGDVLDDFADAIALDIEGLERPPRTNPSLDAEAIAFLRALNSRPRLSDFLNPWRGTLVRVLQRRRGGPQFGITRALAERIEQAYAESNVRVSAEYFGLRFQPLFSPPVLVSDQEAKKIGFFVTIRISLYLLAGLLRDSLFSVVNRARQRLAKTWR